MASNPPGWVRDAVFYEIFPDRFASSGRVPKPGPLEAWDAPPTRSGFKGGDLLGIVEHLDELVELGISALYLTPVFASASNHRYHTYDYYRVDPLLGGDEAFRALLDAAHERGLRIVLDGVFNHASRGFWPFSHVLENGAGSPYRDWFHLSAAVRRGERGLAAYPDEATLEALERARRRGPQNGPPSEEVLGYRAWWDLPALPKLNHANPLVREYVYGVAEHWLRFGIDGWRLDVPSEISEPGFWEEFRRRVRAVSPEAYLVGEIWSPAPEWLGDRFDGLMNYPLAEAILSFVGDPGNLDAALLAGTNEFERTVHPIDGGQFGAELERLFGLYEPARIAAMLNLLDSHDTPRFLSLLGGDSDAFRLASLVQLTLPGAPCIYYGDEVGLPGGQDPDCRRAYPWRQEAQDRPLRAFVAGLLGVRRSEPALRRGTLRPLAASGRALAYLLSEADGPSVMVAANAGRAPISLAVEMPSAFRLEQISWPGCEWSSRLAPRTVRGEPLELQLAAREGLLVRCSPAA